MFPIYFPMNARPSYEGASVIIRWILRLYRENKLTTEYNIILYNYPIFFKKFLKMNINEIDCIQLFKNNDNNLIIVFNENIKVNDVKVIFYEKVDKKSEIVFSKYLDFIQEKNELHFKIQASDLPKTYRGMLSDLTGELLISTSENNYRIALEVYDFFLYDSLKFGNKLEELLFKYLAKYGPMTLGALVAKIGSQERLRIKSAELKQICIKLVEEGFIIKNEKDWNTATYFISTSIFDKLVKR